MALALGPVLTAPIAAATRERGEAVAASQVPAAVKATAEKEAKGGPLGQFTKETEKGKTFYEVKIQKNGTQRYVHSSPEGKVLKRESAKREARTEARAQKKESGTK